MVSSVGVFMIPVFLPFVNMVVGVRKAKETSLEENGYVAGRLGWGCDFVYDLSTPVFYRLS